MRRSALLTWVFIACIAAALAEFDGEFPASLNHPAIEYRARPVNDSVAELNRKILEGKIHLKFESAYGYLRSTLEALGIPIESQIAVFSKTSLQADRISPRTPRTIFFNDLVTVAWMRDGFIELAAQDPQQGVIFYTLDQKPIDQPVFKRENERCLRCHLSDASLGVPGMMVRSMYTASDGRPLLLYGGYTSDHRSPLDERWGGWYVTGKHSVGRHLGNALMTDLDQPESVVTNRTLHLESLKDKCDRDACLSPYSDIAALMVFDHQMRMSNLLTRMGWEIRVAFYQKQTANRLLTLAPDNRRNLSGLLDDTAKELVDYLLFVDEAPLAGRIESTSGFTEKFARPGPHDKRGRSLRSLDLEHRLMRYRCSYMIYADAFDGLPGEAREAIYKRMWQILSGEEKADKYARLTLADRRAIVEILRETKNGLPAYFQPVTR